MRKEQIQNDLKKRFGKSLKFTIATHRGALFSDYYTINIQGAEIDDKKILKSLVGDVANGKSVCIDDGSMVSITASTIITALSIFQIISNF